MSPKETRMGSEKRPHNEELHSLYRLPNIVRVIKEFGRARLTAPMKEDRSI